MKIIACYNIKGGVGKTATAVNLSYLAASEGAQTLVWDLDPQGAASFYFRIKAKVKGGGKKLISGKHELDDLIKGTDYPNLDLIPADFSYRNMDLLLEDSKKPTRRLRKLLTTLADEYDYIFLDCPPSISLVSESVFQAADVLLVPTIPTTLSVRTLDQLLKFCKKKGIDDITIMPFFSMVDSRKQLHRLIIERPPSSVKGLLKETIPYASGIERMGIMRAPFPSYAAKGKAADAYKAMWDEIKLRLNTA